MRLRRWRVPQAVRLNQPNTFQTAVVINQSDATKHALDVNTDNGMGLGLLSRFVVENSGGARAIDIDFRNVVVRIGSTDPAQDGGSSALYFESPAGTAAYSALVVFLPGSTTPTFLISSQGDLIIQPVTSIALEIRTAGDANDHLRISNLGTISWGAGGASALDTTLSRTAPSVLSLGADDVLVTGLNVTASRPSASTVGQGAQFYDTTLHKPIWSDGTNWRDASGTVV